MASPKSLIPLRPSQTLLSREYRPCQHLFVSWPMFLHKVHATVALSPQHPERRPDVSLLNLSYCRPEGKGYCRHSSLVKSAPWKNRTTGINKFLSLALSNCLNFKVVVECYQRSKPEHSLFKEREGVVEHSNTQACRTSSSKRN